MSLANKKLFLLDMDGTIYLDDVLFDGTLDFLDAVKEKGGRYLFLTNNSSRGVESYVEKLQKLGIKAEENDFLTSVDAMIAFLKKKYGKDALGKKIYLFGTESFKQQMRKEGFNIVDRLEDDIETLVIGFDRELTFQKLEDACILLGRGVDFFATNPDWVCPTWYGSVPDCGSFCKMLETATGRTPYFVGKPQPDMVLMSLEKFGYKAEEAVMIGDRLYTDIDCGVNAGIDTVFVLSGEGTLDDLDKSQVKPTWILDNIEEILRRVKNETEL